MPVPLMKCLIAYGEFAQRKNSLDIQEVFDLPYVAVSLKISHLWMGRIPAYSLAPYKITYSFHSAFETYLLTSQACPYSKSW